MKSIDELWKVLRKYGINNEEDLKKKQKEIFIDISIFTKPLEINK